MPKCAFGRFALSLCAACATLVLPGSALAYAMTSYASRLPASVVVISLTSLVPILAATFLLFRYEKSGGRRLGIVLCFLLAVTVAVLLGPGLRREAETNDYRASVLLVGGIVPISLGMMSRLKLWPRVLLVTLGALLSTTLTALVHGLVVKWVNANWDRISSVLG